MLPPQGLSPTVSTQGFFWEQHQGCKDPAGAGTWCTPWAHQLGGVEERGHEKKEVLGWGRTVTACPGQDATSKGMPRTETGLEARGHGQEMSFWSPAMG